MSLTKTIIPVLFKGGVNQKSPDKLVQSGEFVALENCVRRKTGRVDKRFGFSAMSTAIFGGGNLSNPQYLANFEDDVIALANDRLYSYSAANDVWLDKGAASTAQVTLTPVVRNAAVQSQPDVAYGGGLLCVVYEDSRGGIRYCIYDDSSDASLVFDGSIDATATTVRPKVVATPNGFVIGYLALKSGSDYYLYSQPISYSAPTTLNTGLRNTVVNGTAHNGPWDMDLYGSYICFAYNNNGSNLSLGYMDANGVVGSPAGNSLPAPVNPTTGVANTLVVAGDAMNQKVWIVYNATGADHVLVYSADLAAAASANTATTSITVAMSAVVRAADGYLAVYSEQPGSTARDNLVTHAVVSWPGTGSATVITASATLARSVGIASRAFEVAGRQYITAAHDNALQPTYYTIRDDGYIVSSALPGVGGGVSASNGTTHGNICRVVIDHAGNYATVLLQRIQQEISGGGTVLAVNIGLTKAAFNFSGSRYGVPLGRNFHIVGGVLLMYDGVAAVEHGFLIYPEGTNGDGTLNTGVSAAGTALTGTDVYYFQAIYEWTDGKGQVHRSAPSILTAKAVGTNGNKITVTVPTLRLTAKSGPSVNIVLYASVANQSTVLYRYSSTANDKTADTVAVDFTAPPATTKEIIYVTGGVLDNIVAPPAKCIHAHKTRLFVAGIGDHTVRFSKYANPDEGVAFQDIVTLRLESEGGDITALATMDDKLIIFKASRIYYVSGEGPFDTGQQSDYFTPILIARDVGTTNPLSIVEVTGGVMFQSAKGIYMLNRAAQATYVGTPVEDTALANAVTSATLISTVDEVRFTTLSDTMVYNYYFNQWSTFTNYAAVSACNGLGTYLHFTPAAVAMRETPDEYLDAGVRIQIGIETGWFSTSGMQGFQRIYKMLLLGDLNAEAFCRVKIAYNFEASYNETIYFDTRVGTDSASVYGEGTTYGSVTPYGGSGSTVFQFRIIPRLMKCESFKLRIEDLDTVTIAGGNSFSLVALTFEVGKKYGAYKLPARNTV